VSVAGGIGQVPEETVKLVHRVLALDKGTSFTTNYLLCNGTSKAIRNLEWTRDNITLQHDNIVAPQSMAIRILLNNAADNSILVGIYTCKDRETGSMESIYINSEEKFSYDIIILNLLRPKFSLY